MTVRKTLVILLMIPPFLHAENDSLRLNRLQQDIRIMESRISNVMQTQNQVLRETQALQLEMIRMESNSDSLNQKVASQIAENQSQMENFQAQQVQTERALNLALDQFQEQFEDQNRVAAKLEAQLAGQINYQLLAAGIAFLVLIIAFVLINRRSVNRSLASSQASWNHFQDHFLKNN